MLQQRASLVIGLTYFELNDFENAIQYLDKVVPGNEYYPKALIGLGWCYLKKRQYQNVISPLENFVLNYSNHHLLAESFLLLGQAHLKLRLYAKAIYYFNELQTMFSTPFDSSTVDSLSTEIKKFQKRIESQKLDLLVLEAKLLDTIQLTSRELIPRYMQEQIDQLETRRSLMIDRIFSEKALISQLNGILANLEQKLQIRTRDWRSYAEYGISRALFLQERRQ